MQDEKILKLESLFSDLHKIHEANKSNYRDWLAMNTANISTIDECIVQKVTLSNGFVVEVSFKQVKE